MDNQPAGSVPVLRLLVKGDGCLDQQCSRLVIIVRREVKEQCCAREETVVAGAQ